MYLVFAIRELPNQRLDFFETDGWEHLKAMGGQDFNGGDSAEIAPVVPIGRPYEIRVVVSEPLGYNETRAICKDDVVFGQTFFDRGRRRHHENFAWPEPEKHNWTVAIWDIRQSPVDGFLQEMEMADDWKWRERCGRKVSNLVKKLPC